MTMSTHNSLRQRLMRGGAWAMLAKLIRSFSGLAVNALLARLLSGDDLGTYFITFSLVTILSMFARLGMGGAAVRLIAESLALGKVENIWPIIKYTSFFSFSAILVVGFIFQLFGWQWANTAFNSNKFDDISLYVSAWIALLALQSLFADYLRGLHIISWAVFVDGVITTIISTLILFYLLFFFGNITLHNAIHISLISLFITIIISFFIISGHIKKVGPVSKVSASRIWSIGWPQMITNLATFSLSEAAVIVLAIYQPAANVAIYVTALKLMIIIRFSQFIVNSVIPPFVAELNATGQTKRLEKILRNITTLITLPSAFFVFAFIIWGQEILTLVYGENYSKGYLILAILSAGQLVNVAVGSCARVLMLTGHQHVLMRISFIIVFMTILIALPVTQLYGGIGLAIVFSISIILQSLVVLFVLRYKLGIWTHFMIPTYANIAYLKNALHPNK